MDRRQDFGHPRMIRIYRYILTHDTGMACCRWLGGAVDAIVAQENMNPDITVFIIFS